VTFEHCIITSLDANHEFFVDMFGTLRHQNGCQHLLSLD